MYKYFKLMFFMVLVLSPYSHVWAQNYSTQESMDYNRFVRVKQEIAGLMERHSALKINYMSLQNKLTALQEVVWQRRREISDIQGRATEVDSHRMSTKELYKTFEEKLKQNQDALMVEESRAIHLYKQLKDIEKTQELERLKLKELEYQKQELVMEQQLKDLDTKKYSVDIDVNDVERLKKELNRYQRKEKELKRLVKQIEKREGSFSDEIRKFQYENKSLEKKVEWIKKEVEFKGRENSNLLDKKLLLQNNLEGYLVKKKAEKKLLEEKVSRLEFDYQDFEKRVDVSIKRQQRKRELLRDIVMLDRENQNLRNQVEELETNIHILEEE